MGSLGESDKGADGAVLGWLRLVYAPDIAGGMGREQPSQAADALGESPALTQGNPYLACAVGDEAALRAATSSDVAG